MADPRFFITASALSVREIERLVQHTVPDAKLLGSNDQSRIIGVAALSDDDLSSKAIFCQTKAVGQSLSGKPFGLCFAPAEFATDLRAQGTVLITAVPKLCFALLAAHLHTQRTIFDHGEPPLIDPTAQIHPSAVIGPGAVIGAGAMIGPLVAIGPGVVIGANSVIGARVSIFCAVLGRRVSILAGAVIGEEGFGFVTGAASIVRLPQLGRVIIGDDVEIGANTTIDRGTLSDTIIGDGCKIDNLVQIGHNVRVGEHTIFAAQSGAAGSAIVGRNVAVGAQAGMTEGVVVGDGAKIAGQSGVMRDVPAGETWGGTPAQLNRDWLRGVATVSRLVRKRSESS